MYTTSFVFLRYMKPVLLQPAHARRDGETGLSWSLVRKPASLA